ncbi:hypothetical protein [Acinetobacter sp. ANC 5378]|uniref:hypothetical protein n=1 Tax=Acinetobacter sp. ANC 5378 TaxID=2731249 RepID=UPI00148F7DD4|nr:hypothetical protein [Acinetobacter sp. ANC 5378]NNG82046.1 hypothetical protein [Acinetobacter sp. ANC 5378]
MAVQPQTPYKEYTANGSTKSFALEFDCDNQDHLIVLVDDIEPVIGTWSLSGGAVVFGIAPSAGSVIKITRKTPLARAINYQSYDNSFSYAALNKDLDRAWYALQDLGYKLGQYDFDYTYAVDTANQANTKSNQALQTANSALVNSENALAETQPILRGGTGATTAEGARSNLDVYGKSEVVALIQTGGQGNIVPIEGGGTGADNAGDARGNLSVYSIQEVDSEISDAINAIPNATETVAGKAKIATTAIAKSGINDTDIITAKKLRDALNAKGDAPVYGFRGFVRVLGNGTVFSSKGAIASVSKVSVGVYLITVDNPNGSTLFPLLTTGSTSFEFGIIAVAESTTTIRVYCKNTYDGSSADQNFTLGVHF